MATFTALAAARHHVLAQGRLGRRARRADGRSAHSGRRRREPPRHGRPRTADARARRADATSSRPTTTDGCSSTSCVLTDEPTIVCAQAGEVNTGAFDPFHADRRRPGRCGERVDPRRRRVRALGGRPRVAPAPRRRRRPRGLVGDRRAQVAQRPVRLGHRVHRSPGVAQRRVLGPRRVPRLRRDNARRRSTGTRSTRAAPAASRSTPRSARSAAAGIAEIVERCCRHARRFAAGLATARRRGAERRRAEPGALPLRAPMPRPSAVLRRRAGRAARRG